MRWREFWNYLWHERMGYYRPMMLTTVHLTDDLKVQEEAERRVSKLEEAIAIIDATKNAMKNDLKRDKQVKRK